MSTPTPPITPTPDDGDGDDKFAQITSQLTDLSALDAPTSADTLDAGPAPEPALTPPGRGPVPHPPPNPEPAEPLAEPAGSAPVEEAMGRDGWVRPTGPTDRHELAINYPLRHAIKIGFAMTVIAAGVGQTMFFAGFFGGGLTGYLLAVGIAAFAEVTMIGSGDSALRHKVERNNGWQMLLGVSAAVAVGATTMQVAHWMAQDEPVMALTFGAASLLGWVVHIASGLIAANGHLAREDAYLAELARRRQKREAAEDAALAAEPAPKPARTVTTSRRKPQAAVEQKRATKSIALQIGADQGARTPAQLRDALKQAGYSLPASSSTLENWARELRTH